MQPKPFLCDPTRAHEFPRAKATFVVRLQQKYQMKINSSSALMKLSEKERKEFFEAFPHIHKTWKENGFEALETQAADSIVGDSPACGSGGNALSVITIDDDEDEAVGGLGGMNARRAEEDERQKEKNRMEILIPDHAVPISNTPLSGEGESFDKESLSGGTLSEDFKNAFMGSLKSVLATQREGLEKVAVRREATIRSQTNILAALLDAQNVQHKDLEKVAARQEMMTQSQTDILVALLDAPNRALAETQKVHEAILRLLEEPEHRDGRDRHLMPARSPPPGRDRRNGSRGVQKASHSSLRRDQRNRSRGGRMASHSSLGRGRGNRSRGGRMASPSSLEWHRENQGSRSRGGDNGEGPSDAN